MKRRILLYAQHQFATIGYSRISIMDFASDLKMSKSTFYKYFASKEELLFAVIDDYYDTFEQEIQSVVQDDRMDVPGKIKAFLLLVRRRFSGLQPSVVEDFRRAVPEAYAHLEERRKTIITGRLVHLFGQGAKDGTFRSDIPPFITANILVQSLQHLEHLEHPEIIGDLPYTFADMFHQVFSVIMEGSLSEKGRVQFRS